MLFSADVFDLEEGRGERTQNGTLKSCLLVGRQGPSRRHPCSAPWLPFCFGVLH